MNRGSMSTGTAASLSSSALDRRPHDAQTLAERLRLRVVPLGLDRHDLARQGRHAVLDLDRD